MSELIVIGGPTASGKTKAAIQLAKKLGCPILSADSRQFFREMNIGTAKPSFDELKLVQHYFINNKSIEEDFSSGDFEREVLALLDELFLKHNKIILVGGSGLYIDAVCKGMDNLPKSNQVRAKLNEEFEMEGIESLQKKLEQRDPKFYANCDFQNPIRVIRALEIIELSGKTMAENLNQNKNKRPFSVRYLILDLPREDLYNRINNRVDLMMNQGLLHEALTLMAYREKNALQTVGYKELFEFFDGKIELAQAIELIKQNSRRYAKRQITWFKRYEDATWIHPTVFDDLKFLAEF